MSIHEKLLTDCGQNVDAIDYEKIHDTVANNIQKILQNISVMLRMEKQFSITSISPTARDQMLSVRSETQILINETESLLDMLYTCKDRDLRLRRERLMNSFKKILNDFQKIQKKLVQFEKKVVQHKRKSIMSINFPAHQSFQDNQEESPLLQEQVQIDEAELIQSIEQDHLVIKELEENIVDVNHIFSHLCAMVHGQATKIDAISDDVEETLHNVEHSARNLEKASLLKRKYTKKRFIIWIIILIIVVIVSVVIYFSVRK